MNGFELLARVLVVLIIGATASGGLLRSPIVEPYKSIASSAVMLVALVACCRLAGLV